MEITNKTINYILETLDIQRGYIAKDGITQESYYNGLKAMATAILTDINSEKGAITWDEITKTHKIEPEALTKDNRKIYTSYDGTEFLSETDKLEYEIKWAEEVVKEIERNKSADNMLGVQMEDDLADYIWLRPKDSKEVYAINYVYDFELDDCIIGEWICICEAEGYNSASPLEENISYAKDLIEKFGYKVEITPPPLCPHCRKPLAKSDNPEYTYQCYSCDEDFYSIEVTEERIK